MSSIPESQHSQLVVNSSGKKETRGSLIADSSAIATEAQKLSPTSLAAFKLYLILLVPSMASVIVGYDITGEPKYLEYQRRTICLLQVMNYINGME